MANYEQYYEKSYKVLEDYIYGAKLIPTEKEWNKRAAKDKLLTSPSMTYISGMAFPKLCKKIYKQMRHGIGREVIEIGQPLNESEGNEYDNQNNI